MLPLAMRFHTTHVLLAVVWGLLLVPGQSWGQDATGGSASEDAEQGTSAEEGRPLAFVRRFKPQVNVFNRASQKYLRADRGEKLFDGDTLATDKNGYAAVQFMDKSLAKVKPNSVLLVNGSVDDDTRSTSTRILMNAGEVLMNVDDATRGDFEVATSSSVATVKGTEFGSSVERTGESYHFVLEGSVNVRATESGQTEDIGEGMFARVDPEGQTITTGQLDQAERERRRKEFEEAEEKMKPKTLELRFRDQDGNVRTLEIKYFENEGEQDGGNQ